MRRDLDDPELVVGDGGAEFGGQANSPMRTGPDRCQPSQHDSVTRVSHGDELSRYASSVGESPVTSGDEIADHQVIIRGGQVEAVVVPLEEYRALKALEQREAELYWAVHEARHPSHRGDDAPDGKVYDSMDALLADLGSDG